MKCRILFFFLVLWLLYSCQVSKTLDQWDSSEINLLMANINIEEPIFTQKDIHFDSIVTLAGTRIVGKKLESIKLKLFYFGGYIRGYYNLSDQDNKNLQIFGKKLGPHLAFKVATKINMKESDGYIVLNNSHMGIWSNGSVNFAKGTIALTKNNKEYTLLDRW